MRHWELFAHDADIGIRGVGETPAAAFEEGAMALTAVVSDPASVAPHMEVPISCAAPDLQLLFVEWLNALVFEMATKNMLFGRFAVRIDHGRLRGTAWGEPVDPGRHEPAAEIKGATYTALRVAETEDENWVAECVVDV